VLIGPADVGRHNLQDDAVWGVFPAERIGFARGHLQLRVIDRFDFDFSRANVGNSTIARHTKSPLLLKMFQYRPELARQFHHRRHHSSRVPLSGLN
jgi:hypothetical protein